MPPKLTEPQELDLLRNLARDLASMQALAREAATSPSWTSTRLIIGLFLGFALRAQSLVKDTQNE